MLTEIMTNAVISIVFKHTEKSIVDKINKDTLELEIQNTLDSMKTSNDLDTEVSEELFQRITEFFWDDHADLVLTALTGTDSERKKARAEIYGSAYIATGAKTEGEKKAVYNSVKEVLYVARSLLRDQMSLTDRFMIAELSEKIEQKSNDLGDRITNEIKTIVSSPLNHNKLNELVENRNLMELKKASDSFDEYMEKAHRLYPDYGIAKDQQGYFVSKPLSPEAEKKYPPTYKLKGIASIGDDILPKLTLEDIEYAYRHQKEIKVDIIDAKKLLGDIEDPFQDEARSLIGATLIKEPEPFLPAQPFSIKIDDETIYEYIELRLEEILDNGISVISNREQENRPIDFKVLIDNMDNNHSFSIGINSKSNKNHLRFLKFMKASKEGASISVYSLKEGETLIKGRCRDLDINRDLDSIDKEIAFREWICEIEKYFNIEITLPPGVTLWEHHMTENIYQLLYEKTAPVEGNRFNLDLILHDGSKKSIREIEDTDMYIAIEMDEKIDLFDYVFTMPIRRLFVPVRILELDELKAKIECLDVGDQVTIHLDVSDGKCTDQLVGNPTAKPSVSHNS